MSKALLLLFFCFSLLVLLPAPQYHFWKLTIGVTELGLFFAFITFLIYTLIFLQTGFDTFFSIITIFSTILYLLPTFHAKSLASDLKYQLKSAFGEAQYVDYEAFELNKSFYNKNYSYVITDSIVYKSASDISLSFDYYYYSTNIQHKKRPCIISVHGGAWSSGDNKMFVDFDKHLADLGYVVIDITYRLAPKHLFPAPVDDVFDVYKYIVENAEKLNVDTANIFLLGRSAGGQIATLAAEKLGKDKIKGIISIYTPHDMVWGYSLPGNPLIMDSRKVLEDYLGGTYEEAKANFHAASTVENANENMPPILMIHGKRDEMVAYEHNLHLIEKLKQLRVPYYLLSFPYATHGCDYFLNGPSGQLSCYAIDYFCKSFSEK